jgi:branched-chain amino acid aminotransferase
MIERAFMYGDLLFETIKVVGGQICFAQKHYNRLLRGAEILKFDVSQFTYASFNDAILTALGNKKETRIRFTVYRDSQGFYTPKSNTIKWNVDVFELDNQEKVCSKLGVFFEYQKSCNILSSLKSGNALLYVMAGLYAQQHLLDDCIILNQYGRVAEAISSNIFIVKGDRLYTPPLDEGCVEGIMRAVVLETVLSKDIEVHEIPINLKEIEDADEVFLTNAIYGIIPVKSFRLSEYKSTFSMHLKSNIGF